MTITGMTGVGPVINGMTGVGPVVALQHPECVDHESWPCACTHLFARDERRFLKARIEDLERIAQAAEEMRDTSDARVRELEAEIGRRDARRAANNIRHKANRKRRTAKRELAKAAKIAQWNAVVKQRDEARERVKSLECHAMAAATFVRKLEGALMSIVGETIEWDRSLHARVMRILEHRCVTLPTVDPTRPVQRTFLDEQLVTIGSEATHAAYRHRVGSVCGERTDDVQVWIRGESEARWFPRQDVYPLPPGVTLDASVQRYEPTLAAPIDAWPGSIGPDDDASDVVEIVNDLLRSHGLKVETDIIETRDRFRIRLAQRGIPGEAAPKSKSAYNLSPKLDEATIETCARVVDGLRWPAEDLDPGRELLNSGFATAAQSIRFLSGEDDETRRRLLSDACAKVQP